MDERLKIQPGQERLTPAQEAEARRFAAERIAAQLSTEPVNEPETGRLLRQAYKVAGFSPPKHIRWLDGPLQLVELFLPEPVWEHWVQNRGEAGCQSVGARGAALPVFRRGVWWKLEQVKRQVKDRVRDSVGYHIWGSVWDQVGATVQNTVWASMRDHVSWPDARKWPSPWDRIWGRVLSSVESSVYATRGPYGGFPEERGWEWNHEGARDSLEEIRSASIAAYKEAPWLADDRFFDEYLEPNELHALAHFNERVSGYWLGEDLALLLRRPRRLTRDAAGRLHNAGGKCVEYHDGWGFYAWHGVLVSEQLILAPETLTREDFLGERNLEVRRIMQERMGERFVSELGGQVVNSSPRGTLYEVRLPEDDSERVARYVQVQDPSTPRQYFLRVPPTVQTAAEAVAWGFQFSVEEYQPAQET